MYAKVFSQIFDSSIADDYQLRHFFVDMLVLADRYGLVEMTPRAIAARTRMPLELVLSLLAKLEAPDPESRTPNFEGRRIAKFSDCCKWGWKILNYEYYSNLAREDQRRERTLERVKRFNEKHRNDKELNEDGVPLTLINAPLTPLSVVAGTVAVAVKEKRGAGGSGLPLIPQPLATPEFTAAWAEWLEYRRSKKKPVSAKAAAKQFKDCERWGVDGAVQSIETSIRCDWQGLFEPRNGNSYHSKLPTTTAHDDQQRAEHNTSF
jgi:hypothetical protein